MPDENTAVAVVTASEKISLAQANMHRLQAKNLDSVNIFDDFEDKSLPVIIKAADLKAGAVIIGEIINISIYDDGKISSALVTLDLMDKNPLYTGPDSNVPKLIKIGMKAAMPVGAVLARALGTDAAKTTTVEKQTKDIIANGFISHDEKLGTWSNGAIIAMRYTGTGKERGEGKHAPHLWDIKAKKASGVTITHSEKASPSAKKK